MDSSSNSLWTRVPHVASQSTDRPNSRHGYMSSSRRITTSGRSSRTLWPASGTVHRSARGSNVTIDCANRLNFASSSPTTRRKGRAERRQAPAIASASRRGRAPRARDRGRRDDARGAAGAARRALPEPVAAATGKSAWASQRSQNTSSGSLRKSSCHVWSSACLSARSRSVSRPGCTAIRGGAVEQLGVSLQKP